MAIPTPPDLLNDPVVADRLSYWTGRFSRLFRLNHDDEQDLRQEMVLAILMQAYRFDPQRSPWRVFLNMLCLRAARLFIQRVMRWRTDEEPFPDEELAIEALLKQCPQRQQAAGHDPLEQIDWQDWFTSIIGNVSPTLQQMLMLYAQHQNMVEVAHALGIHRNTVARRFKALRRRLAAAYAREKILTLMVLSPDDATMGEDGDDTPTGGCDA